jgi:hypothetical protein
MNPQWHFRPKHPGDDITDPITGEFFADGSIDNPATALVREALQNALDAGKSAGQSGGVVRVRIGLFRHSHALPAAAANHWFNTLRPHLTVAGNGLRDAPKIYEPCDFLVIEDFGTSGLTGDTESDSADGARNNFVDFMRSDGRTRKEAGDRGSWGVGKNVFPRSSRINAFIAYTVRRDDDRRLVMGKSILKIRRVGGEQYQPACYLGAAWDPREVPRPTEDAEVEERLRRDFYLSRRDEPGLSVILPWPDPDIGFKELFRAVATEYYYAILAGGLQVTLVDNAAEYVLTADSITGMVAERWPDQAPSVELAAWSLQEHEPFVLLPPPANGPQKWDSDLVPPDVRAAIGAALLQQERVTVRVPLHVQAAAGSAVPTLFHIFLEQHDRDRTLSPSFFREQLCISGVKRAVGFPRVRALVVIEDEPLAELLRAAEPPNHTDWDIKTANFKNVYRHGNHVVTFVKTAVKQLMGFVRAGDDEPDLTVAMDFFAITERDDDSPPGGKRKQKKPGEETPPEFPGIQARPRSYAIAPVERGFVVRRSATGGTLPRTLYVTMAYDVLFGSPWKQFEPADFDLTRRNRSGLEVAAAGGVAFNALDANRVQLTLDGSDFEFSIRGFDANRDLIVRAYNPRERIDANTSSELHEPQEA